MVFLAQLSDALDKDKILGVSAEFIDTMRCCSLSCGFSHVLSGQWRPGLQPASSKELKGPEEAGRVTCIQTGLFY